MSEITFELELPHTFVKETTKKVSKQILSLNVALNYSGMWYQARKKQFYKDCRKLLTGLEPKKVEKINYIHYHIGCSDRQDLMNLGSLVDKMFQDFLVYEKILVDDNIKVVNDVRFTGELVPKGHTFVRVKVSCQ